MSHLAIERLAELADGEPTAPEREHLEVCAMCASEREAYARLVSLAADEHRRIAPPISDWRSLSDRLRVEGLLTSPSVQSPRPTVNRRVVLFGGSTAAAILLLCGTALGRLSAGLSPSEAFAFGVRGSRADSTGGPDGLSRSEFATSAEALQALQRSQRDYERAVQYLATHDTSTSESASEIYRTRLAALDEMAETSLRALQRTPADPFMSQMYMTTLDAREMTLTKLGTALPVGARLTRF